MYREEKGFSIAEALITLMIVSLILAAVLPVVSKKSKTSDAIWHYVVSGTGANSDVYYGASNSQSAIIGNTSAPDSSKGSRLVIVTPEDSSGDTIQRSLIDFYQKTSTGMTNIGRIAFDDTTDVSGNNIGNIAIGKNALIKNLAPSGNNTAVGYSTLSSNTQGWGNTAVGTEVMVKNISGNENISLGDHSLYSNTTGYQNVSVGRAAMYFNSYGSGNTAVGYYSLAGYSISRSDEQTGSANTAIGEFSLFSNIDGSSNTAAGSHSLYCNTNGYSNTATGIYALFSNKNGYHNTADGANALYSNRTGRANKAAGSGALYSNLTGNQNTADGAYALKINESGSYNTASGYSSMYSNIDGSSNTAIGVETLFSNTSGSNNIAIGYRSGDETNSSNKLYIEGRGLTYKGDNALIYGDFDKRFLKINSGASGAVLFGNDPSLPYVTYDMNFDGGIDGTYAFNNIGASTGYTGIRYKGEERFTVYNGGGAYIYGPLYVNGNIIAAGTITPSDKRLKNIKGNYDLGLERILNLKVKEYTFKSTSKDVYDKRKHTGVIAQELQKIIPNAVVEGPGNNKYKTLLYIDSNEVLFTCVNAIKQLYSKFVNIQSQIHSLNNKISKLEKENKELQIKMSQLEKEIKNIKK